MSSLTFFVFIIGSLLTISHADSFNCTTEQPCQGKTLNCTNGIDCVLTCDADFICQNVVLNCPDSAGCYVFANAFLTALSSTINAKNADFLNFIVSANDGGSSSDIICPENGLCLFESLNGRFSCSGCDIIGSNGGDIRVVGRTSNSLANVRIRGENAASVEVEAIGSADDIFSNSNLWCPLDSVPGTCTIINNGARRTIQGINIFAVDGLLDISFDGIGWSNIFRSRINIICDDDYSKQCEIIYDQTSDSVVCDSNEDDGEFCQVLPTPSPVPPPTIEPFTYSPTEEPTSMPLQLP